MKSEYDLEIDRILKEIKKAKATVVGLQFPEGLKKYAVEVAERVEEDTNTTTVIFLGPTYGACDTNKDTCKKLGVDLLVHFGHTEFECQ